MKSWYESKTIWLGLATIVTAVVVECGVAVRNQGGAEGD